MHQPDPAIAALADIHHAYLLGLQLMVSTREGPQVVGPWITGLFRRQHEEKFLASFEKLGLRDMPDAVACAKYHVMSNSMGGVPVEYMYESDRKAWVRFRYPRWMFDGPAICGVPIEASRGFLRGWYAQNGVSLNNPRLGFVCVSEDMTGEFGFCGYFKEFDQPLSDDERLQFAHGELPPPFDPSAQPAPPDEQWDPARLAKANRNYAVEYIRNGIRELISVIGEEQTRTLGGLAARLTGLQYYPQLLRALAREEGDVLEAGRLLKTLFQGMGDGVELEAAEDHGRVTLVHHGLRLVRGIDEPARGVLLHCWGELWRGAMRSQRQLKALEFVDRGDELIWTIKLLQAMD